MSYKIKNRHRLKSKDIRKISQQINEDYGVSSLDEKAVFETGEYEDINFVFIDDIPCFFYENNKLFFTLKGIERLKPSKKQVVVDMGAVKFVTSGADVMAPGITDADTDIFKSSAVWICDEKHHKPLAVGIAMLTGNEMISQKKGKAVKIIHYVGDKIWGFVAKSL